MGMMGRRNTGFWRAFFQYSTIPLFLSSYSSVYSSSAGGASTCKLIFFCFFKNDGTETAIKCKG